MDQLYFEDGYYEGKYFVYIADVRVGLEPYIVIDYLAQDFFEDRGSLFTLTGTLTRQAFQEFNADFTSAFSSVAIGGKLQTATASIESAFTVSASVIKTARAETALTSAFTSATTSQKTARSSVALTNIANLSAQAARTRLLTASASAAVSVSAVAQKTTQTSATLSSQLEFTASAQRSRSTSATLDSAATQTSNTQKTASAIASWTSAFAPTITARVSVDPGSDLEAQFTVSALIGVIKQADPAAPISGVRFNNNTTTGVGDTFIKIAHYNSPPGGPSLSNEYAVAFWAYSPIGVVFTHHPTGTYANGHMKFTSSSFQLRSPHPSQDYRTATWSNLNTAGWHHYIVYQDYSSPDPLVKLYVDGVLQSEPTIFTYDDGNTPPSPPTDDLLAVWYETNTQYLHWVIGAEMTSWRDSINQDTNLALSIEPMQGGLSQFVSYWTTVPDFTDSATRQKLYNLGPVELGEQGTSSGLARPNIYLRLSNYQDLVQRGSLNLYAAPGPNNQPPAPRIQWREITDLDYNPDWDNNNWVLTDIHTADVQDGQGEGFLAGFTFSVDTVTVLETQSNLASTATLTAVIGLRSSGVVSMVCASTLTASAIKTVGAASAISATATQTAVNQRVRYAGADLTSSATLSAVAYKVQPAAATLTFTATQTATGYRIQRATASLQAQSTFTATIDDRTRDAIVLEAGVSTLSITYTRLRIAASSLSSTASIGLEYLVVKAVGSAMTSTATISANAVKVIVSQGTLSAQFTIASTVFRAIIAQAHLQVTGFVLTQGDILNFDPCREISVDQETRTRRILPESRLLIVEPATRHLNVVQETRVLTIDSETRLNTLKC